MTCLVRGIHVKLRSSALGPHSGFTWPRTRNHLVSPFLRFVTVGRGTVQFTYWYLTCSGMGQAAQLVGRYQQSNDHMQVCYDVEGLVSVAAVGAHIQI